MTATERTLHYTKIKSEADPLEPDKPDPSWPRHGQITFIDVHLRYKPEGMDVLKGISCQIQPAQKVSVLHSGSKYR